MALGLNRFSSYLVSRISYLVSRISYLVSRISYLQNIKKRYNLSHAFCMQTIGRSPLR
ncbi:hypothetical protein OH492_07610 [Vibrio chagasii]|nr:hypothetical protein [Vibrio chagasii]